MAKPWSEQAACIGLGFDLFFDPDRVEEAKAFCETCPVRLPCLDEHVKDDGVSGGLSEEEKARLRRRRRKYAAQFRYDLYDRQHYQMRQ